jgi:hypothetical protein
MTRSINSKPARVLPLLALSLAVLVVASTAGARRATVHVRQGSGRIIVCESRDGGALYIARMCRRHDKRIVWGAAGANGAAGAKGAQGANGGTGPQGAAGATGATGPEGPGAVEYTYATSAPAASEQDTPLGAAGPFSSLTASCTVSGSIVMVALGATNANPVSYDETRTEVTNGGTVTTTLQTATQPASSAPLDLIGEANTSNAGDGYNHASLVVTSPAHGDLDVFEHVSHADNTCHLSVVWTPAS